MAYSRGRVPKPEDYGVFLNEETQRIERALKSLGIASIQVANAEPDQAYRGLIRYAISPWDPIGTGFQGFVYHNGNAWVKLDADVAVQSNTAVQIHSANTKSTPVDDDELGLVDSEAPWVLKKLTWANNKVTLRNYFDTYYGSNVANTILAATSKATPVDDDLIGLVDSAASNVLKKLTWANTKSTLNSIFLANTTLTTKGDVIVRDSSVPRRLGVGSDLQVLTANSVATAGVDWQPTSLVRVHTSDVGAVNTANQLQNWFPTNGNVSVNAGMTYFVEGYLDLIDTATTHTQSLAIQGTAGIEQFTLNVMHVDAANNAVANSAAGPSAITSVNWEGPGQQALATALVINTTSNVGKHFTWVRGLIICNTAGTLLPRFAVSAVGAPVAGHTGPTIKRGTFFRLTPLMANTSANNTPGWS